MAKRKEATPAPLTRFASILARLQNHPVLATIAVLALIITAAGATTDSIAKLTGFVRKLRELTKPQYGELVNNIEKYAINASITRESYQGPLIITPIALFRDTDTSADGAANNYTYLLCRFTNTGSTAVIVGTVVSENRSYPLDDLKLGYYPTVSDLASSQRFFRGRPMTAAERTRRGPMLDIATISPQTTRYAYLNDLQSGWPSQLALTVIDVTDRPAGSARIRIKIHADAVTSPAQ